MASQAPVLLALVSPPMLAGVVFAQWAFVLSLLPQVIVLGLIILAFRNRSFPRDLRRVEGFVIFALIIVLGSLLVAPPFAVLGMPILDALFEAVSGVTSTGLTVAMDAEEWPVPGHLLRGWIQWCGGFAIAFAGLAIFTGTPGASLSMGSSHLSSRDNLSSVKVQARQALLVYVALTFVALVLCLLLLPNWWEAVSVALAAVSTGGFTPRADSLGSYSALAQGVVIGICILAAISLLVYIHIWRDGVRGAFTRSHAPMTFAAMAFGVTVFVVVDFMVNRSNAESLYGGALNFLSAFSTAGFSTGEISGHVALLPLLLLAMVIGGDVGSTAGGIKVARLVVLIQMVRLSIVRVRVPPSAVTYLRDGPDKVDVDRAIAVTALLSIYLAAALIGWGIFLISGVAPLAGLFDVVSALSTVGLSQGVTGPDLPAHLKLVLIVAMLLGRLEFIALIILCLPGTWMKRD